MRTPARACEEACPGVDPADLVDDLERCANRPLGVVFVGDRRPPDGHHRVADELLDDAAMTVDDLSGDREIATQEVADILGVQLFGHRREADEVDEEHRDETQLVGRTSVLGIELGVEAWAPRPGRRPRQPLASRRLPHVPQNLALAGFVAPHTRRRLVRAWPHSTQYLRSGSFGVRQFGQVTTKRSASIVRGGRCPAGYDPTGPGGDNRSALPAVGTWCGATAKMEPDRLGATL